MDKRCIDLCGSMYTLGKSNKTTTSMLTTKQTPRFDALRSRIVVGGRNQSPERDLHKEPLIIYTGYSNILLIILRVFFSFLLIFIFFNRFFSFFPPLKVQGFQHLAKLEEAMQF